MKIKVDITKAKEIMRNRIRAAREDKFKKLDIEYQKADEQGDTDLKKSIAKQKQELRDLTESPAINKAKTLAQLEKAWPFKEEG